MKNLCFTNTLFYLLVIGLYLYEPILGALGQIGLGSFQFIIALKLISEVKKENNIGHKNLKMYFRIMLIWLTLFIIFMCTKIITDYYIVILFISPMVIGLYFVVVTYLFYKNQNS